MKSRYFSKKVLFVFFSLFFVFSLFSFNTDRFNDLLDKWIKEKGYKQGIISRKNIDVNQAILYGRLEKKKEEDVVKEISSKERFVIYDDNYFENVKEIERKKKKKPSVVKKRRFKKKKFDEEPFNNVIDKLVTENRLKGKSLDVDVKEAIEYAKEWKLTPKKLLEFIKKGIFVNPSEVLWEIEKKPFRKKKFKSANLGKQILNVAKGKKVLNVKVGGKKIPIYIEKLKGLKDVTVIQLPCLSQRDWKIKGWRGNVCALHAVGNSEILASDKMNYIQVVKALNSKKTRDRISKLIKENYDGKWLRGIDMVHIEEVKEFCNSGIVNILSPKSKIKRNILNHLSYLDIYFDEDEFDEETKDRNRDPRYRFMKKNIVEVLILNTGGHWIAARLEKLSGSKYAIIFADSIAAKSSKYDNDIDGYQEYFCQLAAQFGMKE